MNDLEKFRIRWHRWLGQKCRKDKPYWTTLLNCNWTNWAEKVFFKNNMGCFFDSWSRDYTKIFFSEAIDLADMNDLIRLDDLYCAEKIGL